MFLNKGKTLALVLALMTCASILSFAPGAQAMEVDWVLEGQSPGERTSFVSAELPNGSIFIALGYNSTAMEHTDSAWLFDPNEMSWTQLADSPVMIDSCSGSYANGKVYIFGGIFSNFTDCTNVLMYEFATDSWSFGPPLPKIGPFVRSLALGDDRIMIAGGGYNDTQECFMFDTSSNSFSSISSMPLGRSGGTFLAHDDSIFYIGGWDPTYVVSDLIFGYSERGDYWYTVNELPQPTAGAAGVVGSDGIVYLIGGSGSTFWASENRQTAIGWSLDYGNFVELPDLDGGVKYAAAFETNDGRIMYLGGHEGWEGNIGVYSLQVWEAEVGLDAASVEQGGSVWLGISMRTNFAEMYGIYGSVLLTQENVTYQVYDVQYPGGNAAMVELSVSEQMPAGDYSLVLIDMSTGKTWQDFDLAPLALTVIEASTTSEQLQELMDENQDLQAQLSSLNDELMETQQDLEDARAELKEATDAKLDAMVGYVILVLVIITLVVGVVALVRKK